MFDSDITRELYGGMMASAIISAASLIGAALLAGAVLYWWISTRG